MGRVRFTEPDVEREREKLNDPNNNIIHCKNYKFSVTKVLTNQLRHQLQFKQTAANSSQAITDNIIVFVTEFLICQSLVSSFC